MNKLAPFLAAALAAPSFAQVPDARPVLVTDPTASAPGSILRVSNLVAGEDEGWAALARVLDASGAEVIGLVGTLTDDDPLGPRVLRLPDVLAGIDQETLFAPRIAGGRLGYLSAAGSGARAGWVDDTLMVRTGDALGAGAGTWTDLDAVFPVAGGGALILGRVQFAGPGSRRALVDHATGTLLLREGQPVPGTSETLQTFGTLDTSPSGNHHVAVGRLAPSDDEVVLLDGAILQIQPLVEARTGDGTAGTLPQGNVGVFTDFREAFVDDAGRVTLRAVVELSNGAIRYSILRDGREIAADGPPLLGIDARGGALTGAIGAELAPLEFEGQDISIARSGIDLDDDGITDPSVQARQPFEDPVISGSGRVLAIAELLDNGTGAPLFSSAVLASVRKEAPEIVCAGQPNFRGVVAHLEAVGSRWTGYNRMRIVATGLPWNVFGLPLVSRSAAGPVPLPGSMGELCLGGSIGRMPFSFVASSFSGGGAEDLYLNLFPQGNGYVSVLPGETWYLQMWYRDIQGQVVSSNLTDAIAVTFR